MNKFLLSFFITGFMASAALAHSDVTDRAPYPPQVPHYHPYDHAWEHTEIVCTPSWWNRGWNASIFAGILTTENNSDFFTGNANFRDVYPIGIAVGKEVCEVWTDNLNFELEAQFVQHTGKQTHQEFQPFVLILRWVNFPWNDTIKTTLAVGDGLSVATRKPKMEVRERGSSKSSPVLNYVLVELTFAHPDFQQLDTFLRYHHRSGVFGTFGGAWDASTTFMAGVKWHF